jgi:hypothetical protein
MTTSNIVATSGLAVHHKQPAICFPGFQFSTPTSTTGISHGASAFRHVRSLVDDLHVPGSNFAYFTPRTTAVLQADGSQEVTKNSRLLKVFRVVAVRSKRKTGTRVEYKIQPYEELISSNRTFRLRKAGEAISFSTFFRLSALNASRRAPPLHLVVNESERAVVESAFQATAKVPVTLPSPKAPRPAPALPSALPPVSPEVLERAVAKTKAAYSQVVPALESLYSHFHRPHTVLHKLVGVAARFIVRHQEKAVSLSSCLPERLRSYVSRTIGTCASAVRRENGLKEFPFQKAGNCLMRFTSTLYQELEKSYRQQLRVVRKQCDKSGYVLSSNAAIAPARTLFPLVIFNQATIETSLSRAYIPLGSFLNQDNEEVLAFISVGSPEEIRFVRKNFLSTGDGYGAPYRIPSIEIPTLGDSSLAKIREVADQLPVLSGDTLTQFNQHVGLHVLQEREDGLLEYGPASERSVHGVFKEYAAVVKMHKAQARNKGPFGAVGPEWGCIWEFPKESSEPSLCSSALSLPPSPRHARYIQDNPVPVPRATRKKRTDRGRGSYKQLVSSAILGRSW